MSVDLSKGREVGQGKDKDDKFQRLSDEVEKLKNEK